MQILGYKHRGWLGPELGLMAMLDFKSINPTIEQYDSFDDYPFPLFYRELDEYYPDSLFILTKRKTASAWADSVIRESNRKTFNDSENIWYEGALSRSNRREILVEKYENHVESVNGYFSQSANFLSICWEEGDGWEKLCKFLEKPVPGINLPHRNKGELLRDQELINRLLQQKGYNKVLLALSEVHGTQLRDYTISELKRTMLDKETVRSGTLDRIKKYLDKSIRARVLK